MSMHMSEKMSRPFWKFDWAEWADKHADGIGDLVLEALQRECPVGQGENAGSLRDSLIYQKISGDHFVRLEFTSDSDHVKFVIEGTVEHDIFPVTAHALHFMGSDGGDVFAASVHHPGTQPNRFHETAWENVRDDTTIMFGQTIQASIT